MAYYRLYFMRAGHIYRCRDFLADGDPEALGIADSFAGPDPMELWCGSRRVRSFEAMAASPEQPAGPSFADMPGFPLFSCLS
jgi:hypothetical protein